MANNLTDNPRSTAPLIVKCVRCQTSVPISTRELTQEVICPQCCQHFRLVSGFGADEENRPHIANFELLERLGAGTFGIVWKARDRRLDREVAVKVPRAHLTPDAQMLFVHEARKAARLNHPNIVHVHEVLDEGSAYIVSELVQGTTLGRWHKETAPTAQQSMALMEKLAKAVHHAHEHGLIHRDLKPDNIIIDHAGEPHITDFGLAKEFSAGVTVTMDNRIVGTPAYMPPEQARGEGYLADARSDVYSLGVIMYELLVGIPPFAGAMAIVLHQVLEVEPLPPRRLVQGLSNDCDTICMKAMDKLPQARYATAKELADDLNRAIAGLPIHARPTGKLEHAWRWVRRNPGLAGLTAALALVLFATTIGSYFGAVSYGKTVERARAFQVQSDAEVARHMTSLGRWSDAVDQYDKVLRESPADQNLRLSKCRALLASGRTDDAIRELDIISRQGNFSPELEAEYQLMRFELQPTFIGADGTSLENETPVPERLLPADRAYLAGLRADSLSDARTQFERAVVADPGHNRANVLLVISLALLGEHDAARQRATFATSFFPEDPNSHIAAAFAAEFNREAADGEGMITRLKAQLPATTFERIERPLALLGALARLDATASREQGLPPIDEALQDPDHPDHKSLLMIFPSGMRLPPALEHAYRDLLIGFGIWLKDSTTENKSARAVQLRQLADKYPTGVFQYFYADSANTLQEGIEYFVEASKRPSPIDVTRLSLGDALTAAVHIVLDHPEQVNDHFRAQCQEALIRFLTLKPMYADHEFLAATAAVVTQDYDLARAFLRRYELYPNLESFVGDDTARENMAYLRVRVEYESGRYGRGLELAEQYLKDFPGTQRKERLLTLFKQAEASLQQDVGKFKEVVQSK